MSRILGGVAVFTLCVAACNDKDISLINDDGGSGGSTAGNAGTGGSSGSAGQGGSSNGGNGGTSGGSSGSAGASAGSAGQGSAGTTGNEIPDGGTDSGPPPGPYTAICETYCASRAAWATGTTDGGVNCAGYDSAACQAACESEVAFNVNDLSCAAYPAAIQCRSSANAWYCQDNSVYDANCVANFGLLPDCSTTCDTEAAAVNACYGS